MSASAGRLPPPHDWHTAARDGSCDRGCAPGECPARHWPGLPHDVAPGRATNEYFARLGRALAPSAAQTPKPPPAPVTPPPAIDAFALSVPVSERARAKAAAQRPRRAKAGR